LIQINTTSEIGFSPASMWVRRGSKNGGSVGFSPPENDAVAEWQLSPLNWKWNWF